MITFFKSGCCSWFFFWGGVFSFFSFFLHFTTKHRFTRPRLGRMFGGPRGWLWKNVMGYVLVKEECAGDLAAAAAVIAFLFSGSSSCRSFFFLFSRADRFARAPRLVLVSTLHSWCRERAAVTLMTPDRSWHWISGR